MKRISKMSLIGALTIISAPAIVTAISCGQSEKYSISINDNRVVLDTHTATKGKPVNIKLKTVDSNQCQLTNVTDVKVGGLSIEGKYDFGYEPEGSGWTHHLNINDGEVIDGQIEIVADVTVNQFNITVNKEVCFTANSTQYYHDTTILLGINSDSIGCSIKGIESVAIGGKPLGADDYTFGAYLDNKQYTHYLSIKEDKDNPHVINGNISIALDIDNAAFVNITCSNNVIFSPEQTEKNKPLSLMLKAEDEDKVISGVEEVTIGGNPIDLSCVKLEKNKSEIQFTHKLTIEDGSLITGAINISMTTTTAPASYSIIMADNNAEISSNKVEKGEALDCFVWPKNGYRLITNAVIKINGERFLGFTFKEYVGEDFPKGTHELIISDPTAIKGDIEIVQVTDKIASFLSIDEMPDKFDATLSQTSIPYGHAGYQTIDVSITRPKDWEFKYGGYIDVIMGGKTYTGAAKITKKDTLGEYSISFDKPTFYIDDDITFCIGEQIQPTLITYEQKICDEGEVDISGLCEVNGIASGPQFWHNDRFEAEITTETTDDKYNFLFNELEIILFSNEQEEYVLEKGVDYDLSVDTSDAKKATVVIFENAINEPSSWNSNISKVVFKYKMLDTIDKFSFFVTNGISTTTYIMPSDRVFEHEFNQDDIVDNTKNIGGIEVLRKKDSGWETLQEETDYTFASNKISLYQTAITNDIKVILKMRAPKDKMTFENDGWDKIAYWASTCDSDLLAQTYNFDDKNDLLLQERSITYDGIEQKVRVIGVNHDYLKCGEEGDMGALKGQTAALTFEFSKLLKDSAGGVTLDIGDDEINGQNYWTYNEGFGSKGKWGHESSIRTYLKGTFASKFDSKVAPWVKTVSKRRLANADISIRSRDPVINKTKFMIFNDQYFIASVTELNGEQGNEGTLPESNKYICEGKAYEAYDDRSGGHDYAWEPRAKQLYNSYEEYWTCSFGILSSLSSGIFDTCEYISGNTPGCPVSQYVDYDMYIAPCFCI